VRIGRLMMGELVEMHREFVRYYGPDDAESPKWMEGKKLNEFLSLLQKSVIEDESNDLTSLMPLYRSVTESYAAELYIYNFSLFVNI
jgi:integrator complex subunit 9